MNTNRSNNLIDIYTSHQSKVSDKWEIYLTEYDRLFFPFRNKSVNLLEIGIQNRGSLEIWAKYFSNANLLIGCDIDKKCLNLKYENPSVEIVVGDATTDNTKNTILNYTKEFDIIIEDGSHISNHIIKAFLDFFPLLKEDGLFIVEDLHCSYWKDWEGGLYFPYSSMSFFKLLTDIINFEHWGIDKNITSYLEGFAQEYNLKIDENLFSFIHSVEFVNSMCIIKKAQPRKNICGKRYIVGTVASVSADPLQVKNTISEAPNQDNNFWSMIKQRPSENYLVLLEQIQKKDQQIQYWRNVANSMKNKSNINKVNTLKDNKLINHNIYQYIKPILDNTIKGDINGFAKMPLISIIMPVYNVDPKWLNLAIKSIENQWYENWELCIVDDKSTNQETINYLKSLINPRIKIKYLKNNLNISGASNEALGLATGEFIALMDNDDELTQDALYEVVKCINENDAEFIYSDEDKLEMNGASSDPHFKPSFAPDMFLAQNYISHLGVIKKDLIDKVGGFEIGLEGSQDYDLYLKVFEYTDKIYHISKVLYHWRKIPGSTASEFNSKSYAQEAGRKSLENAMKRRNIDANVLNGKYPGTYKVEYRIKDNPLVSIIIPFKDKPELLKMCIESILNKTTYKNFEIIGISNNSEENEIFDEMKRLKNLDKRVQFYEYNVPFNYSDINNHAVKNYANGKQIILLNNDIEIISPNWIEEMLMHSQRENVGVVGAKLYYPNDTIQHAGVIIGIGGAAGHAHKYFDRNHIGYFARLNLVQNYSAVTAACLMVKKSIYEEVHGLDKKDLKAAFNDVDFCLRVQEKKYRNIFTPYCEAYHHESISRGAKDTKEKIIRFYKEKDTFCKRHQKILKNGDPYYNYNLTLDRENFNLK